MPESSRLLLVEDNDLNRDMLRRRLERKGYEVGTAIDGVDALKAMRAQLPELVLLDMSLPVKDGWTTCKELRDDPELAGIAVIALTAHAMNEDREKAMAAGCDDYATKPIDFPALLEKIEALLAP